MKHLALLLLLVLMLAHPAFGQMATTQDVTFQSASISTGNGTAHGVSRYTTGGIQFDIAGTASLEIEAIQNDQMSYESLGCANSDTGTLTSTVTASGLYQCSLSGYKNIRARIASCSACTVTATARLSTASSGVGGGGGGGGGGIITDMEDGAGDTIMNAALDSMNVVCTSGCGGTGGSSQADDAGFSVGVNDVNPAGLFYDPIAGVDPVNDHDVGIPRMLQNRIALSALWDAAGNERGANVTASNQVEVAVTNNQVLGAGTNNIGDVDIATMPNEGQQTMIGSISVALASDQSDVPIQDSGNSITVDAPAGTPVAVRPSDGTSALTYHELDLDSGGGTETRIAVGLAAAASGGSVALQGTAANGLEVDVTRLPDEGQQTMANSVSVALASDQSALPVTDNAGALTVDAANDASLNVTIGDGSNTATIRNLAANDAVNVALVDGAGDHITAVGGGVQYTQGDTDTTITGTAILFENNTGTSALGVVSSTDPLPIESVTLTPGTAATNLGKAVAAAGGASDVGVAPLFLRDDSLSTLTPLDGQYTRGRTTSKGALWVAIESTLVGTAAVTDDDAVPKGTVDVTQVVAALYCEGTSDWERCLYDPTNGLAVDVKQVVPGTGATNLGKAVGDAGGATDTVVALGGLRDDTLTTLTPSDGEYVRARFNSVGAMHVTGAGGGVEFNIGDLAGATDTGKLVLVIRDDTLSTLADPDGDLVGLRTNSVGALHVTGGGGGVEYVVNAAAPTDPTGATFVMERDDALSTLSTEAETEWTNPRGSAEGALWTQDFNSDTMTTHLTTLAGAVTGTEVQADIVAALPTGANAIGKLAANSGIDIGDVDVLTMPGVAAEGAALGDGILIQGDDGTDRTNVLVDTAGHFQIDVLTLPALTAGTNNIGDIDILTIAAGDNNIGNVDIVTSAGIAAEGAALGSGILLHGDDGTDRHNLQTNGGGDLKITLDSETVTLTAGANIEGDVAHDGADSGNPLKVGGKAIAHGSNPTAVAASDRTDAYYNRHGIPFVIAGHMNTQTVEWVATTAQANDAIVTISTGSKVALLKIMATVDNATTVDVGIRCGFATVTLPTTPTDGNTAADIVLSHPGIAAGSGVNEGTGGALVGIGADDEDLRCTNEVPTTGSIRVRATYFTIES